MTTTPPGPRSNRRITEFACSLLDFFLAEHFRGSGSREKGNTRVSYRITRQLQSFHVYLYDEPIFRVFCEDWEPFSVWVCTTSFFDGNGAPTRTTRERLNGLLDRLGVHGVLPLGVRIFMDKESSEYNPLFRVGNTERSVAVGQDIATTVCISPNQFELLITGASCEPSPDEDAV